MTGKVLTPKMRRFILGLGPRSREGDLAIVLGLSRHQVARVRCRNPKARRYKAPISRDAVRRAWQRWKAGEPVRIVNLICWAQTTGTRRGRQQENLPANRNRHYTVGDESEMEERIGQERLVEIATTLKRGRPALRVKLKRSGMLSRVYEHSCVRLARRLGVSPGTVNAWCHMREPAEWLELVDTGEVLAIATRPRLRSYLEGNPLTGFHHAIGKIRIVHADDAEWLLTGGYKGGETDWDALYREAVCDPDIGGEL